MKRSLFLQRIRRLVVQPSTFKYFIKRAVHLARERNRFRHCLRAGIPYFGDTCAAFQGGAPRRHAYMQHLVEIETCQSVSQSNRPIFKILEVGSWAGGSAITWADAIKRFNNGKGFVLCIDPWREYFDAEINQGWIFKTMRRALSQGKIFNLFRHNINSAHHDDIVIPIVGPSNKILPAMAEEGLLLDLIFVDGAHTYREVLEDLKNAARLLKKGGILCGDDLEVQRSEINLQDFCKEDLNKDVIHAAKLKRGFHPGVTLAVGEFFNGDVSEREGFWAMRKTENGWERLGLSALRDSSIPKHLLAQ